MTGLEQGLEQGLGQLGELLSYVGLALILLAAGLAASPFVLWWNTARTNRLLARLAEEQERTNALLERLAGEAPAEADSDEFTLD